MSSPTATNKSPKRPRLLRRDTPSPADLRAIKVEGGIANFMLGLGENYLQPFVLFIQLGAAAAGMIATAPILVGSLLQLCAPAAVRALGSRRAWVVLCAVLQAVSLAIIPCALLLESGRGALIFVAATAYWATSFAGGPSWNTWIEELVPPSIRTTFFASRVRICQFCLLASFVVGGIVLQQSKSIGWGEMAFAGIFVTAAIARLVSAAILAMQAEIQPQFQHEVHVPLWEFIRSTRTEAAPRLLIYFLLVQVGVYISGPYFTPYMLGELHFSYIEFMLLVSASLLGKVLCLPLWGALGKRIGTRKLLWIGSVALIPLPFMWIVSKSFAYLVLLQVTAGAMWAGYELAMFLLFFEAIPREKRTSLLTYFNLGNAMAMTLGATIGSVLLVQLGEHTPAYFTIFALSGVVRTIAMVSAIGIPRAFVAPAKIVIRVLTLRPSMGSFDQPVLSRMDEPAPEFRVATYEGRVPATNLRRSGAATEKGSNGANSSGPNGTSGTNGPHPPGTLPISGGKPPQRRISDESSILQALAG